MLNNYDNSQTLASTLGFDTGQIQTAQGTGPDPTLVQKYDTVISNSLNYVDNGLTTQAIAQENLKKSIADGYNNLKANLTAVGDSIASGLNISKDIVIYGGGAVIITAFWHFIGKDIYNISKGK